MAIELARYSQDGAKDSYNFDEYDLFKPASEQKDKAWVETEPDVRHWLRCRHCDKTFSIKRELHIHYGVITEAKRQPSLECKRLSGYEAIEDIKIDLHVVPGMSEQQSNAAKTADRAGNKQWHCINKQCPRGHTKPFNNRSSLGQHLAVVKHRGKLRDEVKAAACREACNVFTAADLDREKNKLRFVPSNA